MRDRGASTALRAALAADPAAAGRDELSQLVRHSATLRSFVDLLELRCNRRARELAAEGESESPVVVLIEDGRLSGKDAAATGERDRVCEEHPEFEDALESGGCSAAHLDVLARLTKRLTDIERADFELLVPTLLAAAEQESAWQFERRIKRHIEAIRARHAPTSDADELDRQRSESHMKRWTDTATGLKMTLLAMDTLRDASFHTAVDARVASLRQREPNADVPFGSLQIDAVVDVVSSSSGTERRVPEVAIHVDHESLLHGRHDRTLCETVDGHPIPITTAQRLCCEAVLAAVVVDTDGTTRQLCAEQRTANRQQRRALAAMYATCAHPTCTAPFSRCRMHHVIWWTRGGKTVLENLLPLCDEHHHLVHEGGWNLQLAPDRTVTWLRPDSTVWRVDRTLDRRAGPSIDGRAPPRKPAVRNPELQPSLC